MLGREVKYVMTEDDHDKRRENQCKLTSSSESPEMFSRMVLTTRSSIRILLVSLDLNECQ